MNNKPTRAAATPEMKCKQENGKNVKLNSATFDRKKMLFI